MQTPCTKSSRQRWSKQMWRRWSLKSKLSLLLPWSSFPNPFTLFPQKTTTSHGGRTNPQGSTRATPKRNNSTSLQQHLPQLPHPIRSHVTSFHDRYNCIFDICRNLCLLLPDTGIEWSHQIGSRHVLVSGIHWSVSESKINIKKGKKSLNVQRM